MHGPDKNCIALKKLINCVFFKFKEAKVTANHDHLHKQLKNLLFEMFG